MPGRRHPRSGATRKLAGAGAAGAAAVLAVAPMAHADAKPKPVSTTTDTGTDAGTARSQGTRVAKDVATPNYGLQKIRMGVQQKDGSWVPAGDTTAGTRLTIVETGDGVEGGSQTATCTTQASTAESGSTATWCTFSEFLARRPNAAVPPSSVPGDQIYVAEPGDTVTITQTSVEPGFVTDPVTQTVGPCENPEGQSGFCADAQQQVFNDAGLPPVAQNDAQTVTPGGTARIAVLGNDTTEGAPATIKIVQPPAHGTATVVDQAGATLRAGARAAQRASAAVIVYTPKAGFFGRDSLRYSLTTGNGTSTATVALRVAAPPTARDDAASTDAGTAVTVDVLANDHRNGGGALTVASVGDPGHGTARIRDGEVVYTPASGFSGTDTFTYVARNSLGSDTATVTVTVNGVANTGVASDDLIALGALLLVTGGAATVAGRRRYRARHASAV